MRGLTATVKELLFPSSVVRTSNPPMDGGLRPNELLDRAPAVLEEDVYEPEDVLVRPDGTVSFTDGTRLHDLVRGHEVRVTELGGPAGALQPWRDGVLVAVEGRGLVAVSARGELRDHCTDPLLRSCLTDFTIVGGTVVATVGSTAHGLDGWSRSLLTADRSGQLVRVDEGKARVVAEGMAWPAGVAPHGEDRVVVALSHGHALESWSISEPGRRAARLVPNLPAYPGRVRRSSRGWWVAAPYVRNRVTELFLDEPELSAELARELRPDEWPVPRLRRENPYRDPMQLGQLRVLGVIKPWAPPRSYGLVLEVSEEGRVLRSFHSRADGLRHGVTGVSEGSGSVVAAVHGARNLVRLEGVDRG